MFTLTSWQWALALFCAFLVGLSKTGVGGLGILVVPVLAGMFQAKESTGILLPMLIFADIFAIVMYRRDANRAILLRLFPFIIPGVVAGFFYLRWVRNDQLKVVIGCIVLAVLALNFVLKSGRLNFSNSGWLPAALFGTLAGFTTMTANAAGSIIAVYLLIMKLDKIEFMGTQAWYFLTINLFKVPFSMGLGLINAESFMFDLKLFPLIAIGALSGYWIIGKIAQKWFERIVYVLAAAGAIRLIVA